MLLNDYQKQALRTDLTGRNLGAKMSRDIVVSLLGLSGEIGTLTTAYKKFMRDGPAYELYKDHVKEELGDILWYMAVLAKKYGLNLGEVATANLDKVADRWVAHNDSVQPAQFLDAAYPPAERIPRYFEIHFYEREIRGKRTVILTRNRRKRASVMFIGEAPGRLGADSSGMLHRSPANQRSDYQFVVEQVRRRGKVAKKINTPTPLDVSVIAEKLIRTKRSISYFSLHKLQYLVEYLHLKRVGVRASNAYFVRQKDGPYCVDLHLYRLQKAIPTLSTTNLKGRLMLSIGAPALDMFAEVQEPHSDLPPPLMDTINLVLGKWGSLSEDKLKAAAYITAPMRQILRIERRGQTNMYNAPIDFVGSTQKIKGD